jgi:hypothetical protein
MRAGRQVVATHLAALCLGCCLLGCRLGLLLLLLVAALLLRTGLSLGSLRRAKRGAVQRHNMRTMEEYVETGLIGGCGRSEVVKCMHVHMRCMAWACRRLLC